MSSRQGDSSGSRANPPSKTTSNKALVNRAGGRSTKGPADDSEHPCPQRSSRSTFLGSSRRTCRAPPAKARPDAAYRSRTCHTGRAPMASFGPVMPPTGLRRGRAISSGTRARDHRGIAASGRIGIPISVWDAAHPGNRGRDNRSGGRAAAVRRDHGSANQLDCPNACRGNTRRCAVLRFLSRESAGAQARRVDATASSRDWAAPDDRHRRPNFTLTLPRVRIERCHDPWCHPRSDRCRAWFCGRDRRQASPGIAPIAQRRKRTQRRDLRAPAVDPPRQYLRCGGSSASCRRRGDRLRSALWRRRGCSCLGNRHLRWTAKFDRSEHGGRSSLWLRRSPPTGRQPRAEGPDSSQRSWPALSSVCLPATRWHRRCDSPRKRDSRSTA